MLNSEENAPQCNEPGNTISLQAIVDAHLKRLLDLRDAAVACHAGLTTTSQLDWEQYRASLPPEPRVGGGTQYSEASVRAASWLTANALKDLLSLKLIYFEHIRQMIELAEVTAMNLEPEGKNAEARRRMVAKPENLEASLKELDRILVGGFTQGPEMRALEVLFAIFASQLSGITIPGIKGPLTVTLCEPEITGDPGAGRQLPYAVRQVQRSFPEPAAAHADKELLYQVFFTAFVICRTIAEKCQNTLLAGRDERTPVGTV